MENLWSWEPAALEEVYVLLEFVVGPTDDSGDVFSVIVCTPEALRVRASNDAVINDRGALIVRAFEWEGIRQHIEATVAAVPHGDWPSAVAILLRHYFWEYEDAK